MKRPQLVWDLKPVSYIIGKDAVSISVKKLSNYSKRFVLTDDNTLEQCLPVFNRLTEDLNIDGVISINATNNNKNIEETIDVWKKLSDYGADRDSILINLGGGVVTDLGGFAAATYKRGIDFVNYPTSLLGMVDAAIGGKTGLDFAGIKNQIGLFTNPKCVVIDPTFLKTLNKRQLLSGYAEMLKCGLIMDRDLWASIADIKCSEISDWDSLIVQSARNKVDIVRHDLHEIGIRKILNFGHTVGHAIESHFLTNSNDVTHGAAVAAGMICETYISSKLFDFSKEQFNEIIDVIDMNFDRINIKIDDIEKLNTYMRQDKKIKGGKHKFSLLRKLGKAVHDIDVDDNLIEESIIFYIENKK